MLELVPRPLSFLQGIVTSYGCAIGVHTLHIHKSADGNCFVPSPAESSVITVEGPCTEQSEQILQRQSLFGSMGACYQPARPMKLLGILMYCMHWGKSNFTRPVLMSVLDFFG